MTHRLATLQCFASRNVLQNHRRSLLGVAAVAGGVAVLMYVKGIQNGFVAGRLDRGLLLQAGHVAVKSKERRIADGALLARGLKRFPGVEAAAARTRFEGVLKAGARSAGVAVIGSDAAAEARTSPVAAAIVEGTFLGDPLTAGAVALTVGTDLARRLDLQLGDAAALLVEGADGALVAERCELTGIFATGGAALDRSVAYVPRAAANELLLPEDDASEVVLRLTRAKEADRVADRFAALPELRGLTIETWRVLAPEIGGTVAVLESMERTRNAVLLGLVALLLFNTATLSLYERRRELGMLAALGLDATALAVLLSLETGIVTLAGLAAGLAIGASAASGFPFRVGFDFSGLGSKLTGALEGTGVVYPVLRWENAAAAAAWVAVLTLVVLAIPAWRVLRLDPAEALREKP